MRYIYGWLDVKNIWSTVWYSICHICTIMYCATFLIPSNICHIWVTPLHISSWQFVGYCNCCLSADLVYHQHKNVFQPIHCEWCENGQLIKVDTTEYYETCTWNLVRHHELQRICSYVQKHMGHLHIYSWEVCGPEIVCMELYFNCTVPLLCSMTLKLCVQDSLIPQVIFHMGSHSIQFLSFLRY